MKQFEFVKGRTRLYWEIGRRGAQVTYRSWGPRRKEYVTVRRCRSVEAAKRARKKLIEDQRARGFVETGPKAEAQREAYERTQGPIAVAAAKKSIRDTVVPQLRNLGFMGSFPKLRRVDDDRHCVVWFDWGRAGGFVSVGLAVVTPKKGATVAQDFNRATNVRNRQRTTLSDLVSERDRLLLFFDTASQKWGDDWADELASLLWRRIETKGVAWLQSPDRRPKRKR